jgi:TonB dependent receptor/CarboxypepD_reg-like domain/TonB-dependent Receptor Plug Domain
MKRPKKQTTTLLLAFLLSCSSVFAQNKFTISGTIKDARSGETLLGATVRIEEKASIGISSNEYGFYSLSLPKGSYTFKISFVGYTEVRKVVELDSSIIVNWNLDRKNVNNEVVVRATKKGDNLRKPVMGTETLNMKEIAKLPVIFGEKDIVKTLQLLPGVKSSGEGSSGFSVRGGATDQNLIVLDEAPVYNASHLLGFFSTFNSDAIKDATIIKGNSPAQYGGRLASVLDVKMKEGNNKETNVSGGIGLISSRITVEGPIQKEKSSFIISGRRTYADLFLKATEDFKDSKLFFYDLNAKANYTINKKNRIYASGYFGKDKLSLGTNFGIDWGNTTGTLRWNRIINSKLFSNTSLIYSNYDFNIKLKAGETDFKINTNIKDVNLKQDFSYFSNPKNSLRFGFNAIQHTITPSTTSGTINTSTAKEGREALENALYISNSTKPSDKLSIDYGVRLSAYSLLGGTTYNIYKNNVKIDSVVAKDGAISKTYYNLEPRLTANYRINEVSSIKAGYARNTQHLHQLSNSTGSSPSDQWIGNSYNIKPEIADQVSMGYSRNFDNDNYEFNAETYYKAMQNQVDYKDAADVNNAPDVESELLFGKGRAYGVELMFKKKAGNLTGWVGYTLSKTERQIDGINFNKWYNAKQDRTHDLSIVGTYQLNTKWSLSGLFVYSTGNAVTFPTGKYSLNGITVYEYGNRNANRMPANHRLDISATYEPTKKRRFQGTWNFGLYNVYGRENAYTIAFKDNPDDASRTQAVQTSLFRWVPSVTYNFKF